MEAGWKAVRDLQMMRGQHFSLHYLQCFCNPSTTSRTLPPFSHFFFFSGKSKKMQSFGYVI